MPGQFYKIPVVVLPDPVMYLEMYNTGCGERPQ